MDPLKTSTPFEKLNKKRKKDKTKNSKISPKKAKMSMNSTGYYTQESTTATPEESVKTEKKKRKKKTKEQSSPEVFTSPEAPLSLSQVVTPDKPAPIMSLTKSANICDEDGWSQGKLECLLQNMKKHLPTEDNKSYLFRLKKMQWEEVAVEGFTAEQCQKKWTQLQAKVRHFRTLRELIEDIQEIDEVLHPERQERPKKPNSIYIQFNIDYRKKHQNCSMAEVGEAYANMTEKKRQKYKDKVKRETERYTEQLEKYKLANPGLIVTKEKVHMHHNHKEKPSHPLSAQQLYVDNQVKRAIEKNPQFSKRKGSEDFRRAWYGLKDKKKIKWINKAIDSEKEYLEKVSDYIRLHPDYSAKPYKSILTKGEQKIKDKLDGKPEKPLSAWGLFTSITIPQLPHIASRERMAECSRKWKSLTDEERLKYTTKASKAKEKYDEKYKKYVDGLSEEERLKLNEPKKKAKKRAASSVDVPIKEEIAEENQSRITNYFRSNSKESSSGDESDMSEVLPLTQNPKTSKSNKVVPSSLPTDSSSSSDEEENTDNKKHVTIQKPSYTSKKKKEDDSSSSSGDSSSDSESEPEKSVPTKSPSPTKKAKLTPEASKSPVTPLTVSRPVPPKTPAPNKHDVSSSSSSSSGSSSESESETDDEEDKVIGMKSVPTKSPSPTKKAKLTPEASKTPVTPLTVSRPVPPKTPAPSKGDKSTSSSSSSGSSSESESETDDEEDKVIGMLPVQKSPFSAAVSKAQSSSSSSGSDSDSDSESEEKTKKKTKTASAKPVKVKAESTSPSKTKNKQWKHLR